MSGWGLGDQGDGGRGSYFCPVGGSEVNFFLWAWDIHQVFPGGVSVVWCLCRWLAGVSPGSSTEGSGGVFNYGKDSTLLAYNAYIID